MIQILNDRKFYQYVLVGGTSALLDISLFLILNHWLAIHYLITASMTFMVATLFNYILCTLFVFKQNCKHSAQKRMFLTYVVSGIGLCIHHGILLLTFESFAFPIIISKLIAMGTAFGWNFLSRKHLVFAT